MSDAEGLYERPKIYPTNLLEISDGIFKRGNFLDSRNKPKPINPIEDLKTRYPNQNTFKNFFLTSFFLRAAFSQGLFYFPDSLKHKLRKMDEIFVIIGRR